MGNENERLIDDTRDPIDDVYADKVSQGDLLEDGEEPESYEDEEDRRRCSTHE